MTPAGQIALALSQSLRFSWFYGQYQLAQRRVRPAMTRTDVPDAMPDSRALLAQLFALLRRDHANVAQGFYPPPHDMWPRPDEVLAMSRRFFRDLAAVDRRRRSGRIDEPLGTRQRSDAGPYPRYFLQNFHYQSDGYLSDASAELYDYQVEVLFFGGADAMRRQALVPLYGALRRAGATPAILLDVACGTGRFLRFAADAQPRLRAIGLDLSPNYLDHAADALAGRPAVAFLHANAEAIPLADASVDVASCIFVFHELPARARSAVAGEIARVLKPGGRLLFVDSLQFGDVPAFDPLLEFFPMAYHEPYFDDYARADLDRLFAAAGLVRRRAEPIYLSKLAVYERPAHR